MLTPLPLHRFVKSGFYLVALSLLLAGALMFDTWNLVHQLPFEDWLAAYQGHTPTFLLIFSVFALACLPYIYFNMNRKWGEMLQLLALAIMMGSFVFGFRAATMALWILALTAVVTGIVNRKIYLKPIHLLLIVLFLIRILFWLFSDQKFSAIEQSLSFIIFPVIFMFLPVSDHLKSQALRVGAAFYVAMALYLLFRVWMFQDGNQIPWMEFLRHGKVYYGMYLNAPFVDHPSCFVAAMALLFAMAYGGVSLARHRILWRCLMLIPLCAGVLAIVVTGSRVGIVIAAGIGLAYLVFLIPVKFWIQALLIVLIGGTAFAVVSKTQEEVLKKAHDPVRTALILEAGKQIREKPALGRGVAELRFAYPMGPGDTMVLNTPHNQVYTDLVRFGFVGTFPLLVLLLFVAFRSLWPKVNYLLLFWLIIYLPIMGIETPFEAAALMIPMIFSLCFFMATDQPTSKETFWN